MDDLTVVYYTSNRDDPGFDGRIRATLSETMGTLPLVSVSQQPLDFGHNICVGNVGVSGHNIFRQYQIGVESATTRYVCPAEADMLYPPEYFQYRPPTDNALYCMVPVYICFTKFRIRGGFFAKRHSEGSIIVNRDHILRILDEELRGTPLWRDGVERGPEENDPHPGPFRDRLRTREKVSMSVPCISFRTEHQTHPKTPYRQDGRVMTLPHWGSSGDLVRRYVNGA
jgi:hypothetical protein